MFNPFHSISGDQLLLSSLAALAALFVGYLLRLQVWEIRKRRHMARRGLRFGMIQEVRALKRAPAIAPELVLTHATQEPAFVSRRDTSPKNWTPSPLGLHSDIRWN